MTEIHHSQEYALAHPDAQAKVHSGKRFTTPMDAAKELGEDLTGEKVKVKCNDGEEREIEIAFNFFQVTPAQKYEKVYAKLNPPSYDRTTCYMVKGRSPLAKTAVWFTEKAFDGSDDFKALKAKIDGIMKKHKEHHNEKLKTELVNSHSAVGKKAAAELADVAKKYGVMGVYDWFKQNGFKTDHIKPRDLDALAKSLKKDGKIISMWNLTSGPDGHGHNEGLGLIVDWHAKVLRHFPWSDT